MSPNLRRSPLADERVVADYSRPRPEFQPRIVTAAVDTTRASLRTSFVRPSRVVPSG